MLVTLVAGSGGMPHIIIFYIIHNYVTSYHHCPDSTVDNHYVYVCSHIASRRWKVWGSKALFYEKCCTPLQYYVHVFLSAT